MVLCKPCTRQPEPVATRIYKPIMHIPVGYAIALSYYVTCSMTMHVCL